MRLGTMFLVCLSCSAATSMFAGTIPYPSAGQIAPEVATYAASNSGVDLYFTGYSAVLDDTISVFDVNTGYNSGPLLDNQTTAVGTEVAVGTTPGQINAGDRLILYINTPLGQFASAGSDSADGVNHAYVTPFPGGMVGGVLVPSGYFVGMEDLPNGISDFDYNDDMFVLTGIATVTPEPGSLLLLGTGLLGGMAVLSYRRKAAARV